MYNVIVFSSYTSYKKEVFLTNVLITNPLITFPMMRNCSDLGKSPVINPLFIMLEIGQTYFKNAALQRKIFKYVWPFFDILKERIKHENIFTNSKY